jgi:hypothetical protein
MNERFATRFKNEKIKPYREFGRISDHAFTTRNTLSCECNGRVFRKTTRFNQKRFARDCGNFRGKYRNLNRTYIHWKLFDYVELFVNTGPKKKRYWVDVTGLGS